MYDNYELQGTFIHSIGKRKATAGEWAEGIIGAAAIVVLALVLLQLAAK